MLPEQVVNLDNTQWPPSVRSTGMVCGGSFLGFNIKLCHFRNIPSSHAAAMQFCWERPWMGPSSICKPSTTATYLGRAAAQHIMLTLTRQQRFLSALAKVDREDPQSTNRSRPSPHLPRWGCFTGSLGRHISHAPSQPGGTATEGRTKGSTAAKPSRQRLASCMPDPMSSKPASRMRETTSSRPETAAASYRA
jgi:hypothetical protein